MKGNHYILQDQYLFSYLAQQQRQTLGIKLCNQNVYMIFTQPVFLPSY